MEPFLNQSSNDSALVLGDEAITFGALYRLADMMANELRHAFEPKERVIFSSKGVFAYVAGMFAAWRCGLVFCCWDGKSDYSALSNLIGAAGIVVTDERGEFSVHRTSHLSGAPIEQVVPRKGNFLIATSGSSGAPKGVLLRFERIIENALLAGRALDIASGEFRRWCIHLDLSLMSAVSHLFMAWHASLPLRLMSAFDDIAILNEFAKGHVGFGGAPIQLAKVNKSVSSVSGGVMLVSSGDFLSKQTIQDVSVKNPKISVASFYGLTELSGRFCVMTAKDVRERPGAAGRPLLPESLRIENSQVIAESQLLFEGYFRPSRGFCQHVGPFPTGDLGRLDSDGFLWLSGRSNDIFKVSGLKVSRRVVEATLAASGVLTGINFVVLPVPHETLGTCCALFIERAPGQHHPKLRDIIAVIKERLPSTHIPVYSYRVTVLPTLGNGKLDKQYLITNHASLDRWH